MNLTEVMIAAWDGGFFTRSNVARKNAEEVASAACLGLITTQTIEKSYGKVWRITPRGCDLLFKEKMPCSPSST